MAKPVTLTHTTAVLLKTILGGRRYGFEIMESTGLASGTVYPALRRLELAGMIESRWEEEKQAAAAQRPPRRYYRLTRNGEKMLTAAVARYPILERLGREKSP
jgi:PadR family transcriptional regulator, regulatory protein PadR